MRVHAQTLDTHTVYVCVCALNRPQGPWALSYNLCVSHFYYNPYPYTYFDSCIVRLVFVSRVAFCCILLSLLLLLTLAASVAAVSSVWWWLTRSLARPDPKRAYSACVCARSLRRALIVATLALTLFLSSRYRSFTLTTSHSRAYILDNIYAPHCPIANCAKRWRHTFILPKLMEKSWKLSSQSGRGRQVTS